MLEKVYINRGIDPLDDILCEYKAGRVLLIRGVHSYTLMKPYVKAALSDVEVGEYIVSGFGPDFDVIDDAIEFYKRFKPDLIVSVGGGKVLDTAKAVRVLADDCDTREAIKCSRVSSKGVPLVAVPTTAGTGSEATQFSVIYIDKEKYSLDHVNVMPDHAVIDGKFVGGASGYVASSSLFDALCQSIEAYWSIRSTYESRRFSKKAIALLMKNLDELYYHKTELNVEDLVIAAHYSGKAINIARTTAPHALSYSMTSKYGIPHGHAVALLLPMFFSENRNRDLQLNDERGYVYVSQIMDELFEMMGCATGAECKDKWKMYMKMVGLEIDLSMLGIISDEDIWLIAASANPERLGNHPVALTKEHIYTLMQNEMR